MLSAVLLITLEDISCITCIETTCQKLQRRQIFAKKKRNFWLYLTRFMLMSPLPIQHLLVPKIGEWYAKECLTDIFVVELQFCVHTGKEVCHKICVDKIVNIPLQKPVLRSNWNMLLDECGCETTKGRSIIFLDQILSMFIKNTVLFLCKGHHSKIQITQKATKKKGLRKEIKRARNPNVQG